MKDHEKQTPAMAYFMSAIKQPSAEGWQLSDKVRQQIIETVVESHPSLHMGQYAFDFSEGSNISSITNWQDMKIWSITEKINNFKTGRLLAFNAIWVY